MAQPPATNPADTVAPQPNGAAAMAPAGAPGDVEDLATRTNVMPQLRSRVVREARLETWFVVNETGDDLATIPVELEPGRSIGRVHVNGESAEFSAGTDLVLVRPRRSLRAGAGTIITIHFR